MLRKESSRVLTKSRVLKHIVKFIPAVLQININVLARVAVKSPKEHCSVLLISEPQVSHQPATLQVFLHDIEVLHLEPLLEQN